MTLYSRSFLCFQIGAIERNAENKGVYSFNPQTLRATRDTEVMVDAWKKFRGGMIQVRVSDDWTADTGDG